MRRLLSTLTVTVVASAIALGGAPALADHTDPSQPQSPLGPPLPGTEMLARGAGEWNFVTNFPPNPGSDLKYFLKDGDLYSASGTLAQGPALWVGQRFLKLMDDGRVLERPEWVADHGSSDCEPNPNILSLQHDQAVTPRIDPLLLADATDSGGRCHDPAGGGLELVDISGLPRARTVKELALTRHVGTSHTVTADPNRPGIFYNNSSESTRNRPWIDIVDARRCLFEDPSIPLKVKRNRCRPLVYRMSWEHRPQWSQRDPDGEESSRRTEEPGSQATCHDSTVVGDILYCAGLNATLIFDIGGMFTETGAPRGEPLRCPRVPGTRTRAMVTDCSRFAASTPENPVPHVTGWRFLGNYNHPGRPANQLNNNLEVPADEGVSVSHESDPSPDGTLLLVTDERGGGVVPPGASCSPGIDNPYGNGGIHFFDITRRVPDPDPDPDPKVAGDEHPPYFPYARQPGGDKAIWRGEPVVPAASFCTVHVIEHMPDEARVFMAYYSQGIKILDYFQNKRGQIVFRETASLAMGSDNDWTAIPYHWVDNPNGTRTYYIMASDIQRGIDIVTWTGPKNRLARDGSAPAPPRDLQSSVAAGDVGLIGLTLIGLPAAFVVGTRRRRRRT